jgi:hypothetical protein
VVRDIEAVCRHLAAGGDVGVLFRRTLKNIRLLTTAVNAFLNQETAAVRPPNLTPGLPENVDRAHFIVEQRHAAAELRQLGG